MPSFPHEEIGKVIFRRRVCCARDGTPCKWRCRFTRANIKHAKCSWTISIDTPIVIVIVAVHTSLTATAPNDQIGSCFDRRIGQLFRLFEESTRERGNGGRQAASPRGPAASRGGCLLRWLLRCRGGGGHCNSVMFECRDKPPAHHSPFVETHSLAPILHLGICHCSPFVEAHSLAPILRIGICHCPGICRCRGPMAVEGFSP